MATTSSDASGSAVVAPKHDYYQTDTQVIISFYIKGCQQDNVQVDVKETSLTLTIVPPSPTANVQLSPLFASVDAATSGVRVLSTKIEISLPKKQPGQHWPKLLGTLVDATPVKESSTSMSEGSSMPIQAPQETVTAPRKQNKWDTFKADEEEDANDIDRFFKSLYANADDDTRRAMMKSYQESGGTALSTNWESVKQGRVETKPPDGMEARRWGA